MLWKMASVVTMHWEVFEELIMRPEQLYSSHVKGLPACDMWLQWLSTFCIKRGMQLAVSVSVTSAPRSAAQMPATPVPAPSSSTLHPRS